MDIRKHERWARDLSYSSFQRQYFQWAQTLLVAPLSSTYNVFGALWNERPITSNFWWRSYLSQLATVVIIIPLCLPIIIDLLYHHKLLQSKSVSKLPEVRLQAAWKQILTIGRRMHRQSEYPALPRRRAVSHSRLRWWEQSHPGMNERDACRNPLSHPAWEREEKRKMQIHEDNPYHNNQAENGIRAQIMCLFTISSYFIIFPLYCVIQTWIFHILQEKHSELLQNFVSSIINSMQKIFLYNIWSLWIIISVIVQLTSLIYIVHCTCTV